DNEIRLFKDNIESLRVTNIFKNRRINIITALIYYIAIIYIYLLTLSVAFFINPMPYEYFFYGVEMTTNILFLIVLGYRCQDYGIHRYVGIIFVIMVSSLITIWQGGTFFVSPDNFIISITKSGVSSMLNLNKSYFFIVMNRIILLFLLIPGNKINRYGEQPKSGFWDGTQLVVDPLNVSIIKSKLHKFWLDLIRRSDGDKDISNTTSTKDELEFMDVLHNVFIKDVFNFNGRSSRDELLLFTVLFSILSMVLSYFSPFIPKILGLNSIVIINVFIDAILFIPLISLLVRRLHDSGNSGLWIFFLIVPVVNIYVLYLIFVKPSV
ncbi:DUF805 domain-containing protein, partial [Veillonella sp.]